MDQFVRISKGAVSKCNARTVAELGMAFEEARGVGQNDQWFRAICFDSNPESDVLGGTRNEAKRSINGWHLARSGRWFPTVDSFKQILDKDSGNSIGGWHPTGSCSSKACRYEHFHWYHLCSASTWDRQRNKWYCRCVTRQRLNELGLSIESDWIAGRGLHFANVLTYLSKDTRRISKVRLCGRDITAESIRASIESQRPESDECKFVSNTCGEQSVLPENDGRSDAEDGTVCLSFEELDRVARRKTNDRREWPGYNKKARFALLDEKEKIQKGLFFTDILFILPSYAQVLYLLEPLAMFFSTWCEFHINVDGKGIHAKEYVSKFFKIDRMNLFMRDPPKKRTLYDGAFYTFKGKTFSKSSLFDDIYCIMYNFFQNQTL